MNTEEVDSQEQLNSPKNDTYGFQNNPSPKFKRSNSLSFVCILTFIGSGISLFSYFMMTFFFDEMRDQIEYNESFAMFNEDMIKIMMQSFEPGRIFYALISIGFIANIVGAYLLWKLQNIGFHVYAIAQCYLIILPLIFGLSYGVPYVSIMWSALFVYMYWLFLKQSTSTTISKNNPFN